MTDIRDSEQTAPATDGDDAAAPSLEESLRQFGAAGRESLMAAFGTGRAFRRLLLADIALARAGLGHACAWACVAAVFGCTSWLLLMAVFVLVLQSLGLSWLTSMLSAALLSLSVTVLAAWKASRYLRYVRLDATRRQLAKWGVGFDDDEPKVAS
ncbi:MAG: phage holin family protein [Xanthomonadaceae bacterium]|jgi:uncharacterized membrane protein YdbT with pleckstrin-like domain|nr:phage holin family protein [Xanthomonadaceae bacterium]